MAHEPDFLAAQALDGGTVVPMLTDCAPYEGSTFAVCVNRSDLPVKVRLFIDHLLEAPSFDEPPALVRPKVLYRYADPAIENLSVGQKTLIRIGPAHAKRVKDKLRALRDEIIARSNPAG